MRRGSWWVPVMGITAVAAGYGVVLEHATTPGPRGFALAALTPAWRAQLELPAAGPAVVVAAHPQCPCLPATLACLRDVLAGHADLPVRLLVYVPKVLPPAWRPDAVATLQRDWGAEVVREDADAALATALGCRTSGHVLVYAATGALVFDGGITGSRGHAGANAAADACARALAGVAVRETPDVFGCPLGADSGAHGDCCRRP